MEHGFWTKDDYFCFIAIELEEVLAHPDFYVGDAVGEGGEDFWSSGMK